MWCALIHKAMLHRTQTLLNHESLLFLACLIANSVSNGVHRALLYGGMKESQPGTTEITLPDTPALAFAALLKYMYTGRMNLTEIKVSHGLMRVCVCVCVCVCVF